jgi:hypothetical protein
MLEYRVHDCPSPYRSPSPRRGLWVREPGHAAHEERRRERRRRHADGPRPHDKVDRVHGKLRIEVLVNLDHRPHQRIDGDSKNENGEGLNDDLPEERAAGQPPLRRHRR